MTPLVKFGSSMEAAMTADVRIGIIGDFNPAYPSHSATNEAIRHAADRLAVSAKVDWLPTPSLLAADAHATLEEYDGLWASPGSPYLSMEGGLAGIRFAREQDRPFLGT
jgi:CTP synthase (UTP-ammonia lyase)